MHKIVVARQDCSSKARDVQLVCIVVGALCAKSSSNPHNCLYRLAAINPDVAAAHILPHKLRLYLTIDTVHVFAAQVIPEL